MSAPKQDAIVWSLGTNALHGFDADTGAVIFNGGGTTVNFQKFNTPMAAKGRIYVAGSKGSVYAFKPQ
jgi:outer membrane protein assembly factor BamB